MPGAYAHLTVVNRFKTSADLKTIEGLLPDKQYQLTRWFRFVELGAVSPDYPYLTVLDDSAKIWADAMHYMRVGDRLKAGVHALQGLKGDAQDKSFAWLMGFASHVAMDVTLHPVVELKVGEYAENSKNHRICEMHQDVFIFQEMNMGPMDLAEFLDSGIGRCSNPGNSDELDLDIATIWERMLKAADPENFDNFSPDFNKWHRRFKAMVDDIAEETSRVPAFARHALADTGMAYPTQDELNSTYLVDLEVPGGGTMAYSDLFNKAQDKVVWLWSLIARGVFGFDNEYETAIHNWNLDTGRRPDGTLEFWS